MATHIFGARNDNPNFSRFFEKFYNEIFFPYLEQNQIEHIIQLGDVFDRRKFINFASLNDCYRYFFDRLKSFKTYIIAGNHDVYYKNTNKLNSLDLLINRPYIEIITNKPKEINIGDVNILLCPWITDDNYEQSLEIIDSTKAQIMMGHFDMIGFEMYKGHISDIGFDPKRFDKFDVVLSGHYHHKSQAGNITYVGTPYQMMWTDYDDQKGFHIFDTDTRELEFVSNPFQMFHKIHYNDLNQPVGYVNGFDITELEGSYVKVIVRNKINPSWFDILIDRLEKVGVADLQVVEDHFHLDLESDDDIISQAEDTLTILKKYVDQIDTTVDKGKLDQLMRNLYREALSVE
ncbi:hypothetical protein EB118_17195 [bacterium]|nr:hypothetical protein [bacterium]NDD85022.1 hypothetical protein [bacterium]NDG31793.1 hypothetical protein [bacterium]